MSSATGDFDAVAIKNYQCLLKKYSKVVGRYYCTVLDVAQLPANKQNDNDLTTPFEIEVVAHPIEEASKQCSLMGRVTTGEAELDGQLCGNPFELLVSGKDDLGLYYNRSPDAMVFRSVGLAGSFLLYGSTFTIFETRGTSNPVIITGSCKQIR